MKAKKIIPYITPKLLLVIVAFISLFLHTSYGEMIGTQQNIILSVVLAILIIIAAYPYIKKWDRDKFLPWFIIAFLGIYALTIFHYIIIHYHVLLGQPKLKALIFYCFDLTALFLAVFLTISFLKLYYFGSKLGRKFLFYIILLFFIISLKVSLFALVAFFAFFHGLKLPWMIDTDHALRKKLLLLLIGFWVAFFWLPKSVFFHPDINGLRPSLLGTNFYNLFIKLLFVYILLLTIRIGISLVETSRYIRSKSVLSYAFTGLIPILILLIVVLFNFLVQVLYYKYYTLYTDNIRRLREYCLNTVKSAELQKAIKELDSHSNNAIPISQLCQYDRKALEQDFPDVFVTLQINDSKTHNSLIKGYSANTPENFRKASSLPSWFIEDINADFYKEKGASFLKAFGKNTLSTQEAILQIYVPINANLVSYIENKYDILVDLSTKGSNTDLSLGEIIKTGKFLSINQIDWQSGKKSQFAELRLYKSWADIFGFASAETLYEDDTISPQILATIFAIVSLSIALSFIIISTFIGWRINRGMRRSLEALVNGMKKIGEGDLHYKINLKSFDEYYRLAKSINTMTEDLRGYMNDTIERQKIEQEVQTATLIQQSMLPEQDPVLNNFEISSFTRPAKQMGGDYYDYLNLTKGKLGVVMGDVSGHGVAAGLLMSMAKSSLYNQIKMSYKVPDVLFAMNNMVYEVLRKRLLMTFCYSILNVEKKKLSFASAGHHFPYLYSNKKQELISLESIAYPLGVRKDIHYKEQTVNLQPGDMLILYTDGIIETRNNAEEDFGFDRFEDLLKRTWHLPAKEIKNTIIQEVDNFAEGNPQFDDITLIVIKVKEL
jgi:serine phosphatase RsbU (regulator of sigma subunit)